MNNKERYKLLCEKQSTIPLFSKPFWMDAVCGSENWDVYLLGKGNDIKAAMTYYMVKDENGVKITKPLLTQNNGIWFNYPSEQKNVARQKFEKKIIDEVCDFIEGLDIYKYEQQYHYKFLNWLPFFWRGYTEITRYTYVIEDTSDLESVRGNYSSNVRKLIKKAEKYLYVDEFSDLKKFYEINRMSFERQNIVIPYSFEFLVQLYNACKKQNACKMLVALDEEKREHSVAMLVWDEESVYYLLNGTDPELKSFQGNMLLLDEGIKMAHNMKKKFDFEGSVIQNINYAFREFGGTMKPYFRIYKEL